MVKTAAFAIVLYLPPKIITTLNLCMWLAIRIASSVSAELKGQFYNNISVMSLTLAPIDSRISSSQPLDHGPLGVK